MRNFGHNLRDLLRSAEVANECENLLALVFVVDANWLQVCIVEGEHRFEVDLKISILASNQPASRDTHLLPLESLDEMRQLQVLENRLDTQCLFQVGVCFFSLHRQTRSTTMLLHLGLPRKSVKEAISRMKPRTSRSLLEFTTLEKPGRRLFVFHNGADVWRF